MPAPRGRGRGARTKNAGTKARLIAITQHGGSSENAGRSKAGEHHQRGYHS